MATTITKTIKSSGGDYSSLSAWEASQQADIVAADQIQAAECYAFASTDNVTISGWTTDATRYIRIYTPLAQRHTGIAGTGFRMTPSTDSLFRLAEENVRIEGMAANINADLNFAADVAGGMSSIDIRISHCLMLNTVSGSTLRVCDFGVTTTGTLRFWNNIIHYDSVGGSNGYGLIPNTGTSYVYQNTFHKCRFGVVIQGTCVLKNNISDTCTSGDYTGSFGAGSTNNLSSDTSAGGTNPKTSKNPVYVDEAGLNLKLSSSDVDANDQGADLSADGNIAISDDIIGTARPQGSAFDIGASEIIAVAPDLFELMGQVWT